MQRKRVLHLYFGLMMVVIAGCGGDTIGQKSNGSDDGSSVSSVDITASPMNVEYGGSTILSWSSSNVSRCTASNDWSGDLVTSGSISQTNLVNDKVYTITCESDDGLVQDAVAVNVDELNSGGDVELTFWSSSSQVLENSPVTLIWSSNNAESCSASGDWSGAKALSGSETTGAITGNSQFILQCEGQSGPVTRSLTITTGSNPANPPTLVISATPETLDFDGSVTLQWSTSDADSCLASGDWSGGKNVSGSEVIANVQSDSTYTLNCSGPGGLVNESVSVVVNDPPVPGLSFSASPLTVNFDSSATLQWNATEVSGCLASGDWSGDKVTSGSETISNLQSDSNFTISCTGAGGTVVDTVTVLVNDPAPEPQLNFDASSTVVNYGGSTVLQWSTTNADSCTASGNWSGNRPTAGSELISNLQSDSVFSLNCVGPSGSVLVSVNVTVIPSTSRNARLSWDRPTVNVDNSNLQDLVGYRVRYGQTSGSYIASRTIDGADNTSCLIENLAPGQWFFVVTAINSADAESDFSSEASLTIQ